MVSLINRGQGRVKVHVNKWWIMRPQCDLTIKPGIIKNLQGGEYECDRMQQEKDPGESFENGNVKSLCVGSF